MNLKRLSVSLMLAGLMFGGASANALKVACVGNSVTYGAGLADPATESYPPQMQALLGDGYEVANFGHSGTTLLTKGHRPYVKQEEFTQALDFNPDIVVIHLGLNDTDPRNWPDYRDEFVADYCALIDTFKVRNPKARVMICRMTPIFHRHPRFKSSTRDWHRQIQDVIEQVAVARDVQLIDLHEPLYHHPDLFARDALHPDKEGAGIIASTVAKAITGNYGGLQLSPLFTDGMVLQRNQPLTISGLANAGEQVTVQFDRQKRSARAGDDGRWSVVLDAMAANAKGKTLKVSAPSRTITLSDVVVGDVWLCSGQSNMAFRVNESDAKEFAAQKAYAGGQKLIRLYDMQPRYLTNNSVWDSIARDKVNHLDYFMPTSWAVADSVNVGRFSAVGFSFGRNIADSVQVPVGLIANAVGGAPAEAWIDRGTLELEEPDILYDFAHNDMIQKWVRERGMYNSSGESPEVRRHPYHPAYLYEAGMLPIEGFPVKGVLWYQGESNAHNAELHSRLFPLLVESWRKGLNSDVPFYFVQLTSINRPSWPTFRDSQRKLAASLPGVDMAVIHDLGNANDVHPRHKMEVGRRLALLALRDVYARNVEASGPVPVKAVAAADGVVTLDLEHAEGLATADGGPVLTFELADAGGLYYAADARVGDDGKIYLHSDKVSQPQSVRYGWQPYTLANVVNSSGLFMSTFVMPVEK